MGGYVRTNEGGGVLKRAKFAMKGAVPSGNKAFYLKKTDGDRAPV